MSYKETIDKLLADANSKAVRVCACGTCASAIKRAEEVIRDLADDDVCAVFMEAVLLAAAAYSQHLANEQRPDVNIAGRIMHFAAYTAPLLREEFVAEMKAKTKK